MTSRRAFGVLASAFFALPLIAAWHAGSTPLSLKLVAAGMVVLTALSPRWGLCALAALLPVTRFFALQIGEPFGGEQIGELLVAPWLVGVFLRSMVAAWPASRLDAPALLLAVVVATGAGLGLFAEQQSTMLPAAFLVSLRQHWLNDYFADRATFEALHSSMPWIEGLALAACVSRVLAAGPSNWRPVIHALLAGAAANAAFAWLRVIEVSTRHGYSARELGHFLLTYRTSTFYADLNAAGSLYAMYVVAAIWIGLKGSRQWRWSLSAAIVVALALWMTGSRTAWASAVVGLAAAWIIARGTSARSAAVGMAAALALVAAVILWNPGRTAQSSSSISVDVRWRMAKIAGQIIAEHPVFGIGPGKFRQFSRAHVTPDFIALFPQTARGENAHNNFLQIWAELGIVGLFAFVWLVGLAVWSVLAADRGGERGAALLGLAGGALAFSLTCLGGHPLLTTEILWIFLLVLGVMTGLAARSGGPAPSGRASTWIAAVLTIFVVAAVPVRVHQLRQRGDFDRVVIGAGPLTDLSADRIYRLAEARSRWFVSSAWRRIEIPLRVTRDSQPPCLVDVEVDGHAANTVEASRDGWTTLALQFEHSAKAPVTRRVDLRVASAGCHLMVGQFKYQE